MKWLLVAAFLAGGPTTASAQSVSGERREPSANPAVSGAPSGPSLEFLEFLGEWEADNGEWMDPLEMRSEDWTSVSNDPPDAKNSESGNAR